jgi:cytosine/adenosine deaminase-related metal-dependent hydrolase
MIGTQRRTVAPTRRDSDTYVVESLIGHPTTGARRIRVRDGVIAEIAAAVPGRSSLICLPLLVNAHDHGRGNGLTAQGIADGPLESWIGRLGADTRGQFELVADSAQQMIRAGIGAAVFCVNPTTSDVEAEMRTAYQAVRSVGIRAALVLPIADLAHRRHGRGRDERGWTVEQTADRLALADRLAADFDDPRVELQLGPVGPQWVSEAVLAQVAEHGRNRGLRVHMHLLESPVQRQWADATYPEGLLTRLDELGLLGERTWFAHGTQLRAAELEQLAARGCGLTLNASSNLRLCSGIPPVESARATVPSLAMGLDGMALNEDHDPWTELRLLRGIAQAQAHRSMPAAEVLDIGFRGAALGTAAPAPIAVGEPADFVLVDVGDRAHLPWGADEILLSAPARVHEVWIGGRRVSRIGG